MQKSVDTFLTKKEHALLKQVYVLFSSDDNFDDRRTLTSREIICQIFGQNSKETTTILQHCSLDEHKAIVRAFIEVMTDVVRNADAVDLAGLKAQIQSPHALQVIRKQIQEKCSDIFGSVNKIIQQFKVFQKLETRISTAHYNIQNNISACMSSEKDAEEQKKATIEAYAVLKAEVVNSILEDKDIFALWAIIQKKKKESLELVEAKLKEEPIKLYYYRNSRGGVSVKLSWDKSSFKVADGRKIRTNQQNDWNEYSHIVSVDYIDTFLFHNNARPVDIWIDPRSVDQYYSFSNQDYSVNLTPSFVAKWWNYDCPELLKYTVNKNNDMSELGCLSSTFVFTLVSASFSHDYIHHDITQEEFQKLTKGYEHTRLYQSIRNALDAQEIKKDPEQIKHIKRYVEDYDLRIQDIIDNHTDEIYAHLKTTFASRVIMLSPEQAKAHGRDFTIRDDFGLDCGFLFIATTNKDYAYRRELLYNTGSVESRWMSLRLPFSSQSITVQDAQFDKVKEIVKQEAGIELYCQITYD